jgi:hypothetical protein
MAQGERSKAILGAVTLACTVAAQSAVAQAEREADGDGGYIMLMPHYVSPDANRRGMNTDDGTGFAFGYGIRSATARGPGSCILLPSAST